MSTSPANILQRLKQLKLWQESQEELLKKTKGILDNSAASDYQTIEGLSAFDTSNELSLKQKNWDSQVISPAKNFHQLLEEKLASDPGIEHVVPKEKKPFLRKGTGLARFRIGAKPPKRPIKKVGNKCDKSGVGVTPLRAPDLSIQPKARWSKVEDSEEHVRRINEIAQIDRSPSEQTLYEKQLEKELLIFEALEEKVENTSFCSTNSSVLRIFGSTPTKTIKRQSVITEEKRVHWESQTNSEDEDVIETNLEKEDIAAILLRLKGLATDSSSSVASSELEDTLIARRDVGVGTENHSECPICGDKLKKAIGEYETKLKDLIDDKDRLSDLRQQLEAKERDFLKRKREFDDQREDLLFEVETEKKKMQKEKQAFQTYMKESQSRPNRRERQEISNLKQELADLTETLKLKESKNGMTQARLRNQIKQLEKENGNLKSEVERLTKENAKRTAEKRVNRKSGDTKILQEINKNINKLAQESNNSRNAAMSKQPGKKTDDRKSLLDTEDSLLDMGSNRNIEDIEAQYENTFRSQSGRDNSRTSDKADNTKEIKYTNGNIKTTSPDGNLITIQYFNGDKQETNLLEGTVKYYFFNRNICQTTYADGLEVVEFPEGVTEKRYKSGKCEVLLPDGVVQTTFPDGTQETLYTDGSVVRINPSGEKILILTNGQKEIETKDYKRREYPDGTVKVLYPDGTQETKYANGRVRIKDCNGTLILDTQS